MCGRRCRWGDLQDLTPISCFPVMHYHIPVSFSQQIDTLQRAANLSNVPITHLYYTEWKQFKGLSSVSIRTLFTVLNYRTSNDSLYVRFEINFLLWIYSPLYQLLLLVFHLNFLIDIWGEIVNQTSVSIRTRKIVWIRIL